MDTAFTLWLLIIGALFMLMALTGTTLKRLPLTTAIIYLAVGFVLGASVLGVLPVDPLDDAALLERVSEIAVLISLFTSGLKLRTPLHEGALDIAPAAGLWRHDADRRHAGAGRGHFSCTCRGVRPFCWGPSCPDRPGAGVRRPGGKPR